MFSVKVYHSIQVIKFTIRCDLISESYNRIHTGNCSLFQTVIFSVLKKNCANEKWRNNIRVFIDKQVKTR